LPDIAETSFTWSGESTVGSQRLAAFFMYRKYGTPKMQEQFSVIRVVHSAQLSGQRFALLKIASGNFYVQSGTVSCSGAELSLRL
jgi:hypothetical protein